MKMNIVSMKTIVWYIPLGFLKLAHKHILIKICPFNVYYHVLVANMLEYLNTAVCGVKTGVKC